jgi:hypothetical protein
LFFGTTSHKQNQYRHTNTGASKNLHDNPFLEHGESGIPFLNIKIAQLTFGFKMRVP